MVLKRRLFCGIAVLMLLSGCALAAPVNCTEMDMYPTLIRLHVIAQDDSDAAQALKLEVRDAVLESVRGAVESCQSADEAFDALNERLADFERAALEVCPEGVGVRAETGVFDFPDREYGGVTVPAGAYRALRIVIGEGEGRNWWCVLYPSLCAPADDGRFSLLGAWLRRIFGGGKR